MTTPTNRATFRGNKAALASKPCLACGRAMSWRKCWAKNWADVKHCWSRVLRGLQSASDLLAVNEVPAW